MKLVLCTQCGDIFSLHVNTRSCACGSSRGKYTDSDMWTAEVSGRDAIPIGFGNESFGNAVKARPYMLNDALMFDAFLIKADSPTVRMVKHVD